LFVVLFGGWQIRLWLIYAWKTRKEILLPTNAIANAGMRVRWNIWNLYIHLCWQTVEQQSIPALAIASAVSMHYKNRHETQWNINRTSYYLSFLFCSWTVVKIIVPWTLTSKI
jgi:hypothetical protein